jgi:hypothetical protein
MWPDKLFSCTYGGWPWLGIAPYLPSLAPHSPHYGRPGSACGAPRSRLALD